MSTAERNECTLACLFLAPSLHSFMLMDLLPRKWYCHSRLGFSTLINLGVSIGGIVDPLSVDNPSLSKQREDKQPFCRWFQVAWDFHLKLIITVCTWISSLQSFSYHRPWKHGDGAEGYYMLGNTDVCWCEFVIFLTILKESVLQMQLFFLTRKPLITATNVFILI